MKQHVSSPRSVVVIGEKEDSHLSFVQAHLTTPMVVIDAAAMASNQELSYALYKGDLHITYNAQSVDNVAGVWVRGRRVNRTISVPVSPVYQDYARSAILQHVHALYAHLEKARWVSDRYAMQRAEYKPLQLQAASRLGFKVPDTLFTSSPARAKKFIDNYPVYIVKPIGSEIPTDKEKDLRFIFYATKLHKNSKLNLSGLPLAPAIFQQAIDPAADLRVTIIGGKVFAAIIVDKKLDPQSSIRDWRVGHYKGDLHIDAYKLPKDVANKCLELVRELDLQYGAIDLVLDKKGEIWFLEINPNGQWAFVEQATGQHMGKAMADLLQG